MSTDIRYNNSEFKRLLIYLSTATWSIDSLDQLKALQKILLVELDKIIVESANFVFKIRSTLSIGIVNLNISLRMIIFHIVQVNTPFLLYLVDINRFFQQSHKLRYLTQLFSSSYMSI